MGHGGISKEKAPEPARAYGGTTREEVYPMLRENWRWLAAYAACAVATVAILADLSSPAMWVLCSVVAAGVAGVVVVTGRKERAL